VTVSPAGATDRDTVVAAYEALRRRVLAGSVFGGPTGLVLFLREGLAAWMARGAAGAAADPERRGAAPLVADAIHAAVVRVLASMALGGLKEMSA
jgi:hypothetical protein